jgi:hypothetical protein
MLLFGGTDLIAYFSDTWELALSGTPTWGELIPMGPVPMSRTDHRAIFDAAGDRLVLFGGGGLGMTLLNDTWALDFLPAVDVAGGLPSSLRLLPAAPNPTRGAARFEYESPAGGEARIAVFSASGRLVRELASGPFPPGRHVATWDAADARGARVSPGVYFYQVSLGGAQRDGKIVILD